jgi:hypothetical protein
MSSLHPDPLRPIAARGIVAALSLCVGESIEKFLANTGAYTIYLTRTRGWSRRAAREGRRAVGRGPLRRQAVSASSAARRGAGKGTGRRVSRST